MAEDDFTAVLWGAAHAARVGIICNGFASRLVNGHGASADSIIVQCKCKGCASRSPSRAPEGNLFTLDNWAAHCGANTEPLRLSVFSVVQPGAPKERVPLLDWLHMANEAMGGESLHRRQLCVLFPGPDDEEGTPYHWRAGTIRHIDPATGAAEVKYHDDRRKRSKAHLYLPLAVMHWARCPPPPETPPRTVAEGCQPLPPLLLPGLQLPPRPSPQPPAPAEEAQARQQPSQQQQQQQAAKTAVMTAAPMPMAATVAHTVKMEVAPSAPTVANLSAAAAMRPKPTLGPDTSCRPITAPPAARPAAALPHSVSLSLLAAAAAADAAAAAAAAAPTKPGPMRRYVKRPHGVDDAQPSSLMTVPPQHKEKKLHDGAAPGEGRPWAAVDACCPSTAAAASTAAATATAMAAPAPALVADALAASACEGGAFSRHSAADGATAAADGTSCGRGRGGGLRFSWPSVDFNNNAHCHLGSVATSAAAAVQILPSYMPPAPQQLQPPKQEYAPADQHFQLYIGGAATAAAAMVAAPSLSTFSSSSADLESLLNAGDDAFDSTADGSPATAVDDFTALTAAAAATGAVGGAEAYYPAYHNAYSSSGTESDGGRRGGAGLVYGGGGSGVFTVQQQQPSQDGRTRSPSLVPSMAAAAAPEPQLQQQALVPAPAAFMPIAYQPAAAACISGGGVGCSFAPLEWQPARTSFSSSGGVVPSYESVPSAAAASAAAATVAAAAAESLAAVAGNSTTRVYWEQYYSMMSSSPQAAPAPAPAPMAVAASSSCGLPQQQQLSPCAAVDNSSGNAFWQPPAPPVTTMPHHPVLASSGSGIFCNAVDTSCGGASAALAAAPPLPLPQAAADEDVADEDLKILFSEIEELQWPLPQPIAA